MANPSSAASSNPFALFGINLNFVTNHYHNTDARSVVVSDPSQIGNPVSTRNRFSYSCGLPSPCSSTGTTSCATPRFIEVLSDEPSQPSCGARPQQNQAPLQMPQSSQTVVQLIATYLPQVMAGVFTVVQAFNNLEPADIEANTRKIQTASEQLIRIAKIAEDTSKQIEHTLNVINPVISAIFKTVRT